MTELTQQEGYPVLTDDEMNVCHEYAFVIDAMYRRLNNEITWAKGDRDYYKSAMTAANESHEKDLVTIGSTMKAAAISNELCGQYENFIEEVTPSLFFGATFKKAAKRTDSFTVTVEVVIESLGDYAAERRVSAILNDAAYAEGEREMVVSVLASRRTDNSDAENEE